MMCDSPEQTQFPNARHLKKDTAFNFSCHKALSCFTECCRLLELALTPYDVLRLRRGTGLTSQEVLDRYVIEEQNEGEAFPRFFLTMIDDGRASCVFIADEGCTLYTHRPGACRAYPLGRAATRNCSGMMQEHFVLLQETHCLGLAEHRENTVANFTDEQGLAEYNRYNDAVASLLQHAKIRQGFTPSEEQVRFFTLALYNIDTFREKLVKGEFPDLSIPGLILQSDEHLLLIAVDWLKEQFFSAG
jgi:uncharacterized protein